MENLTAPSSIIISLNNCVSWYDKKDYNKFKLALNYVHA